MAWWFDDPCFDHETETVGAFTLTGDARHRLQSLSRERGVSCGHVIEVAGVTFRKQAIDQALREGVGVSKHMGVCPPRNPSKLFCPPLLSGICHISHFHLSSPS